MSDIEFVDGLIVKAPREGAPDFVKGSISIKREDLIAWLTKRPDEWINVDIKESKAGKWYAAVNDWKPEQKAGDGAYKNSPASQAAIDASNGIEEGFDDDIPFR